VGAARVTLRPAVTFGGSAPSAAVLRELHEASHEQSFLASSVRTRIDVEPR